MSNVINIGKSEIFFVICSETTRFADDADDALCQTRRGGRSLLPLQKDRPPIWYASQSVGLFVARRL